MTASGETNFECVNSLDQVYFPDNVEFQKKRFEKLKRAFEQQFGTQPQFYSRSPGRVNIIGEHVDYSLYSVLPMALSDKDIVIAVSVTPVATSSADGCTVTLCNMNSEKFPKREIKVNSTSLVNIDATKHEWSNYFLSGLKGVLLHLQKLSSSPLGLVNMQCMVDGSVPTGAGVSSSAAFVCCSALATAKAFAPTISITKKQMSEIAIVSERFVGVESGGMDQSASILGVRNNALNIHFYPSLEVETVPFPSVNSPDDEPVFVVAHTLVVSDKHVTAPVCFNLRVVEMRFASVYLSKHFKLDEWKDVKTLRDFQTLYFKKHGNADDNSSDMKQLKKMSSLIESVFPAESKSAGLSMKQIVTTLEMSEEELKKRYITYPIRAETFQLYKRTKHVIEEALRVLQFKDICSKASEIKASGKDVYQELGQLMNQSQDSCRDLYQCSCPEIDELTTIARKNGALGSRLTGAGWGGCTVSLIKRRQLTGFMDSLKRDYYASKKFNGNYDEVLFYSPPGRGATYVQF